MDTAAAPVVASCGGTDIDIAIKLRCAKRFSVKGSQGIGKGAQVRR